MTIREGSRMNGTSARYASFGAASLLAAALLAAPAFADGLPTKGKTRGPDVVETRPCTTVGNVGLTTDYVFRGISQSSEDAAVQGGVDLTCGRFYVGVWSSSIFDPVQDGGTAEVDLYAGFKHATGPVNWDVGLIYYAYPGNRFFEDYVELKLGASGEVWKGGTLGGTVFYSPDYNGIFGDSVTLEGSFAQALPKVAIFTPTFSATVGNVNLTDVDFDYTYWNVGLTLGFLEKWSVDLRYWDSNLNEGECGGVSNFSTSICDGRVVGTVKYTF
jgi:uncharacterized protein (TIGR02001 family)